MKKFMLILIVLSLFSCSMGNDQLSFEDAVLEVYQIVGKTFYYPGQPNRVTGPNEKPGTCGNYEEEFIYYWNEVLNYDEIYGRAYGAGSSQKVANANFHIKDYKFVPKGTGFQPWNDKYDLGVGDIIYQQIPIILHYGSYPYEHGWPVINYNGDWYGCDPTWWDCDSGHDYLPYKFNF